MFEIIVGVPEFHVRVYPLGATMKAAALLATTLLFTSCTLSKQDFENEQVKHHKINLGDKVLEIALPAKEQDEEFIFGKEKEIPSTVDITNEAIYNKHHVHIFIKKIWGWKSRFIGRTYGNLTFTALVKRVEPDVLSSNDSLIQFIRLKDRNQYASVIGKKENGVLIVELPDAYQSRQINGMEFLYYEVKHRQEYEPYYILRVSDETYLSFSFNYTPNSKESESNWRAAAKEIEKSIVQSIKLLDDNL